MDGVVRWFDAKIGYGFLISPGVPELADADGKPKDVFIHYSKIQMEGFRKLDPNDVVSYDLVWAPNRKPQAENVVLIEKKS